MGTLAGRSFEASVMDTNWNLWGHPAGGGKATHADEMIWAELTDEQQAAIIRLTRERLGDIEERIEENRSSSYDFGHQDGYDEGVSSGREEGLKEGRKALEEYKASVKEVLGG